jgi:hypothetical protein
MKRGNTFPIPFRSIRTICGGTEGAYVIGAMFTAGYSEKAARLAASCEKLRLRYVIHEVPTIHRSISSKGTEDIAYTKPNFIRHLLGAHRRPILYLDADCEFVSKPELMDQLVTSGCDFAIYNWYADKYTDRFVPIELSIRAGEPPIRTRFYRFAGCGRWSTSSQLGCSGAVQFYANSVAARTLLLRWHRTVSSLRGRRGTRFYFQQFDAAFVALVAIEDALAVQVLRADIALDIRRADHQPSGRSYGTFLLHSYRRSQGSEIVLSFVDEAKKSGIAFSPRLHHRHRAAHGMQAR